MKRMLLGVTALLLVSGALVTSRPAHACPIGYDPGFCNQAQCHSSCAAQGGTNGNCQLISCHFQCTCKILN